MKYSDEVATWFKDSGYTTCFFVAGGNIMHLIESFSKSFEMIPVIHEVAAAIAADYFNETSSANNYTKGKAIALVTLGPGATNTLTAVAGAYIDSRELIVLAGQVKSTDLKQKNERQHGIQEIDGVSIFSSVTKKALCLTQRLDEKRFKSLIDFSARDRKGPIYIEICHDVQGSISEPDLDCNNFSEFIIEPEFFEAEVTENIIELKTALRSSLRPLILVGGGFARNRSDLLEIMNSWRIPIATTWHAADRVSSDSPLYAGRPNFFGQRWANIVLQQSDLVIVLGSSLGLQQTGFNLDEFAPLAQVFQIDIENLESQKSRISNLVPIQSEIGTFILKFDNELKAELPDIHYRNDWLAFIEDIRHSLPLVEESTVPDGLYVNPFEFLRFLSNNAPDSLNFIPCSSGGSYTSSMQVFEQKEGTVIVSSRGLGSMGIGLAGAIGAAKANENITWLVDGDGGVLQNIQELATISQLGLPIKIILFNNNGYGSIRSTQQKYFAGNYIGCDSKTGLGQPDFSILARAFQIDYLEVDLNTEEAELVRVLGSGKPAIIEVLISQDQRFLPKIESKLNPDGSMNSAPLHEMYPPLNDSVALRVLKYLQIKGDGNE
jgi:acetolactate synthase I/II/III large subunit